MAVTLGLESLLEDEVAIGVEGNHDILVAGACSDGEAASVVGEELAEEGIAMGGGRTTRGTSKFSLDFVNQTYWHCWERWPMIVSLASGQYLAALE